MQIFIKIYKSYSACFLYRVSYLFDMQLFCTRKKTHLLSYLNTVSLVISNLNGLEYFHGILNVVCVDRWKIKEQNGTVYHRNFLRMQTRNLKNVPKCENTGIYCTSIFFRVLQTSEIQPPPFLNQETACSKCRISLTRDFASIKTYTRSNIRP
jgi:hypothetical protein